MDTAKVYDDTVTRLIELCRDTFKDQMKFYFEGDPVNIPIASLPCIIVEKVSGTVSITDAPTGHDRNLEVISLRLVLNKADDLGGDIDRDLTERKLRLFIEGRDKTTGEYMKGTLMEALRHHITFDDTVFNSDIEIDYDVNPRPNQVFTSEGIVTLTTRGIIPISNRN